MKESALYSNLPVYRTCYEMALEFAKARPELPRDTRYTIGQDLSRVLVDLMVTIYRANSSRADKARLIAEMRRKAVEAQIYFRLLADLRQLGARREAFFMEKTASVSKQLAAWHKSAVAAAGRNGADGRYGPPGGRALPGSETDAAVAGADLRAARNDDFDAKPPSPADGWPECGGSRPAAASRKEKPMSGAGAPFAPVPDAKGGLTATMEETPWR